MLLYRFLVLLCGIVLRKMLFFVDRVLRQIYIEQYQTISLLFVFLLSSLFLLKTLFSSACYLIVHVIAPDFILY